MSYDLSKAVGYQLKSTPASWTTRDVLLYAVGIGAKRDDLQFVYELHKSFAPFPTYPVVLSFKGDNSDVTDFNKSFSSEPIPGLPHFEPGRVVHGSMSVENLKTLPPSSGEGWKIKKRVVGVHENKSGIILDIELLLVDAKEVPYTKMITSSFNVGAKATGQKFSKSIAATPAPSFAVPPKDGKKADHLVTEKVSEEQAILYRLSGDYNPLHIDPTVGGKAGFGGVILHGLASYGIAARAILSKVGANDPRCLSVFAGRFTAPVRPGDTVETSIWESDSSHGSVYGESGGVVEVGFVMKNVTTGKICLGNGVAYVRKAGKSKL